MKGTKSKSINRLASASLVTLCQHPVEAIARGGLGFNGQCNRFTVNVIRGRGGGRGREEAFIDKALACAWIHEAISERA